MSGAPMVSAVDEGPVRILTMTGTPRRGNPMSAELARALHPTLLRLDRREPSSRQAAPVELFGHALLQPAPQHLAPLQRPQGLGLLQAAWRALVPARPGTTTPLPATDRPATEPPPFAG